MFSFAFTCLSFAQPYIIDMVMEDYEKGIISYSESMLYKVYSLYDLSKLPEKYRSGRG